MLRKIAFAFIATASLGIAALAPTSASAWGGGGWHGGWHGHHHNYRPHFYLGGGYGGCYVRRLVATPWGYRYRLVNRCY